MPGQKKIITKERINLTINPEKIKQGKSVAQHMNLSLSQFTEELYERSYKTIFELHENPEEFFEQVKFYLKNIENIYKKNQMEIQHHDKKNS